MIPSDLIKSMEGDLHNFDELTGEIIATLIVNVQRRSLIVADSQAGLEFGKLLRQWDMTWKRLHQSVADLGNVTFRQKEEKP